MIHQVVSMKSGIRMETLFYGAIWVGLVLAEMLGMNFFDDWDGYKKNTPGHWEDTDGDGIPEWHPH